MNKTLATLHTKGDGFWSRAQREVRITKMNVAYVNEEANFGELRVYFNTKDWDTQEHGLIYTDSLWIKELRKYLKGEGLPATPKEVDYSEQGMQGDNYVSLDVSGKFLREVLHRLP